MAKTKNKPEMVKSEPDHDYETQHHLDTLLKAHEIMHDEEKMKKVHKLAGRHKKAITSLDDVKAYTQKKYGPKGQMEDDGE